MESSSEMVPFPLRMTPIESNYRACTIPYRFDSDNPRKPTPTEILWIDLFLNSVPSFREAGRSPGPSRLSSLSHGPQEQWCSRFRF